MKKKYLNNPWVISFVTTGVITSLSLIISSLWYHFGNDDFITIFLNIWTVKIQLWQIVISLILAFTIVLIIRSKRKKVKYAEENVQLDIIVFQRIKELLPSNGSIDFIRDNNFAFSFRSADLNDLRDYTYEQRKPEFYFIHPALEQLKNQLIQQSHSFLNEIASKTYPTRTDRQTVPPEWEIEQPERFTGIVTSLHNHTTMICETYDELIKKGREILKI